MAKASKSEEIIGTNPFRIAQAQLDKAAKMLKLETGVHAILREPVRELHVSIPACFIHTPDKKTKIGGFENYVENE